MLQMFQETSVLLVVGVLGRSRSVTGVPKRRSFSPVCPSVCSRVDPPASILQLHLVLSYIYPTVCPSLASLWFYSRVTGAAIIPKSAFFLLFAARTRIGLALPDCPGENPARFPRGIAGLAPTRAVCPVSLTRPRVPPGARLGDLGPAAADPPGCGILLLRGADHEDEDPDVFLRAPHRLPRLPTGLSALPHPELEGFVTRHRHPGGCCRDFRVFCSPHSNV